MLGNDVEFLDDDGDEVRDEVALADAFFNPRGRRRRASTRS